MFAMIRLFLTCAALPPVTLLMVPRFLDEPGLDTGKRLVEARLEQALTPYPPSAATRPAEPGLVRWHADLDAALAAAATSRKPVLLFQLLGRLDEEFC